MADDWQVGDLALCVDDDFDGPEDMDPFLPVRGGIYTVAGVSPGFLELEEDPDKFNPDYGWNMDRFRKIRPHTPDAEDRETIRLLNGVPIGEPA